MVDWVRGNQQSLVLKPCFSMGGSGVSLGWECSQDEWDRAVDQALLDTVHRPGARGHRLGDLSDLHRGGRRAERARRRPVRLYLGGSRSRRSLLPPCRNRPSQSWRAARIAGPRLRIWIGCAGRPVLAMVRSRRWPTRDALPRTKVRADQAPEGRRSGRTVRLRGPTPAPRERERFRRLRPEDRIAPTGPRSSAPRLTRGVKLHRPWSKAEPIRLCKPDRRALGVQRVRTSPPPRR